MRPSLPAAIATLTLAVTAASAQAPDARPALKDHQYEVVVSGCLKGKRLERPVVQSAPESMPAIALNADNFALDGPKAVMKEIEQHKNHHDQVIGVATVPPSTFLGGTGPTRRVGPISIGIGTGRADAMSGIDRAPKTIKLKVTSLVHVATGCAARG
jgi:hypothetical protein